MYIINNEHVKYMLIYDTWKYIALRATTYSMQCLLFNKFLYLSKKINNLCLDKDLKETLVISNPFMYVQNI